MRVKVIGRYCNCLLYTSDAADEEDSVDLGGRRIIKKNDRGGFTIPTNRLYPHQWNWDSGFTALGISSLDKSRAWQELVMLLNAQWLSLIHI